MKRLCIACMLCLSFGLTVAFADGTEALYLKQCGKCHGADGSKTSGASGGTMLKGQSAEELKAKLEGYRDGSYGGSKKKTMMRMVSKLNDMELDALATHMAGF